MFGFAKILTTLMFVVWFANFAFGHPHVWENPENQLEYKYEPAKNMAAVQQTEMQPFCKDCDPLAEDHIQNDDDVLTNEVTKRMHHDESIENKQSKYNFLYQQHKACSCNHEKRLIDLGNDYFPRYIADMVCLAGGCGPHYECRPKRFKVWAMRLRREDEEPGSEPVPKVLRKYWTGESILTTVDCECIA